jgi:hypothetical protein
MANTRTRKQAKNTGKSDPSENKPLHGAPRQPRRRPARARLGSASVSTDSTVVAAAVLSEATAENDAGPTGPTITNEPAEQADVPSAPQSEGADVMTSSAPVAERPASTKRAKLIGMLERAEGASVAEIGERLGWLPHTVRAAITGLRHAGREVTRGKDENGRSIYRLVLVESRDR